MDSATQTEMRRALAKSISNSNVGKDAVATEWGLKLVELLRANGIIPADWDYDDTSSEAHV